VELARQKGIPYLNLAETIAAGGGEKAYRDDLHLNEKGNLAVGSALFECLKAR
jgi:lysophospholipase L1-like esterase